MTRSMCLPVALAFLVMISWSNASRLASSHKIQATLFPKEEPAAEGGEGEGVHSHTKEEPAAEGGDGEGRVHENSGKVITYGLVATLVLLSFTFAMANSSNRSISNFTYNTLDNVICIFLAVLVFQAIDEVVYDSGLMSETYHTICAFLYACGLLATACALSYLLKGKPTDLLIFLGSAAHFVSFGFMHWAVIVSERNGERLLTSTIVFPVILAIIGFVYLASYQIKKKMGLTEDDEMMEKLDDLENDAGAMAAALSWTMLVCHFIAGEFMDVEESEEATSRNRSQMLMYAITITVVSCIVVPLLSSLAGSASYVMNRLAMFLKSCCGMSSAWAWLIFGKWEFHENTKESSPMFNHIHFAFWTSIATMIVIVILAKIPGKSPAIKKDKALALLCMGLIAGWSWEETFDVGVEVLAEEHPTQTKFYKIFFALSMVAVVLPTHVIYFKPIIVSLPADDDDK